MLRAVQHALAVSNYWYWSVSSTNQMSIVLGDIASGFAFYARDPSELPHGRHPQSHPVQS